MSAWKLTMRHGSDVAHEGFDDTPFDAVRETLAGEAR